MDVKAQLDDRLLAPYRQLRTVAGGDESPWPGTLVRAASGQTCVLVESHRFGRDWAGWSADPEGHVLGALDLVRRAEGHDVVLPVCVERAETFVRRRDASGAPLSDGEAVTLAVSVLRGFAELMSAPATAGRWWVTDAGRPLFASGLGEEAAAHTSAEVLRLLDATSETEVFETAAQAVLADRPSVRDLHAAEERLFAFAQAEPLALTVFGPRRARLTDAADASVEATRGGRRPPSVDFDDEPRGFVARIAAQVDTDLGEAASRFATDVWRRLRAARGGGRRKPWLIAGGLAVAIVTGGFVWPAGADDGAVREQQSESMADASIAESAEPSPAAGGDQPEAESTDAAPAAAADPDDLVAAAEALLTARASCDDDLACLSTVVENPGTAFPAGVIDAPADRRSLSLVDEFGGVAVLRAEAVGAASAPQLVVLVRGGAGWLLRDVYDVENG